MKKTCFILLLTALIALLPVSAEASRKTISESESILSDGRMPKDIEDIKDIIITVREGVVCAVDAGGNILFRTDISENSLTAADRIILSRGIKAGDYLTMISIMENYNS